MLCCCDEAGGKTPGQHRQQPAPGPSRTKPLRFFQQGDGPGDVHVLGLGTIWAGRQWPPQNGRWARVPDSAIDAQLATAVGLLGPNQVRESVQDSNPGFSAPNNLNFL